MTPLYLPTGKILRRWIPSTIHAKMSLLLLIEDSGNRLPQRLPYFFQLRDAGGHQKGSDSGCVLTVGQKIKFQRQAEYGKNDFDSRLREASCRHL